MGPPEISCPGTLNRTGQDADESGVDVDQSGLPYFSFLGWVDLAQSQFGGADISRKENMTTCAALELF